MTNTDPEHWFLPDAEMSPFRAPAFTSGNAVEPLIDGKAYCDHLADRLEVMGDGDYYNFTAWRVTPTHPLRPDVTGSPTYIDQLQALIAAGADVRGLLWYVPGTFLDPIGIAPAHASENADTVRGIIEAGAEAVLDRRLAGRLASHHQKSALLRSEGTDWAYVGGLDVAVDRWDTPAHDQDPEASLRPREGFDAWHDVHVAMRGPAVAQVWQNFRERWNDPRPGHGVWGAPGGALPTPIPESPPAEIAAGNQHVQLLRTLACRDAYPFLPQGEQTIRLAYERAIDRAEHYIYIEDQYGWPCTLAQRLNAAARRGVKVIIMLAREYDLAALRAKHNHLRHDQFLAAVRDGAAQNVFAFHAQRPNDGSDIYVHSKVMIVDDCYLAIGSANIGHRSHTTDSELHVGIVDGDTVPGVMDGVPVTACNLARQVRVDLWSEHLGLGEITDPIAGLDAWPSAEGVQVHHALVHPTPPWWTRRRGPSEAAMNVRTRC